MAVGGRGRAGPGVGRGYPRRRPRPLVETVDPEAGDRTGRQRDHRVHADADDDLDRAECCGTGDGIAAIRAAKPAGMHGIQEWLSFYFKSPMAMNGLQPEHDLFIFSVYNLREERFLDLLRLIAVVRVVLLEDISLTADALVARPLTRGGPHSVRDLAGRRVAFEPGSTSHLLLAQVLRQQGLSLADVVPLHRTAEEAAQALRLGECDAAVTYEPHLAELRQHMPGLRRLATAGATPGLVSDVLVLRTDFMAAEPDSAAAWLRTWSLGVAVYRRAPLRARSRIARQMQVPLTDLQAGFKGIRFFDLKDNRKGLGGWFRHRTLPLILAMQRGNAAQSQTVREAIENGNVDKLAEIVAIVRDTGALDGTREAAAAEAQRAIDAAMQLPDNAYRQAMVVLASQLLNRRT